MSVQKAALELEITRLEANIAKKKKKLLSHPDNVLAQRIIELEDILTERYKQLGRLNMMEEQGLDHVNNNEVP